MQEQNKLSKTAPSDQIVRGVSVGCARMIFLVALLCLVSEPVFAWGPKSCTQTSWAAFVACQNEARDDYWIARGNCYNLSGPGDRAECFKDALSEFRETLEECNDQREARLEVCEDIGEAPYDPLVQPGNFVDFELVLAGGYFSPNTHFPLVPGTIWDYEARDIHNELLERIKVEVLGEFKEILGVNCIVVRDRVWEIDGDEETLVEDTYDWYAQDVDGNVWYFGEIAQEFEEGELVSIDGSWKAGVDYAKPGKIMFANPQAHVEEVYRQEFALGEAEDMGKVIELDASEKVPEASCTGDCLKTEDYTPIEPDVLEYKFYKPGIGLILEVDAETFERVELIDFKTVTP